MPKQQRFMDTSGADPSAVMKGDRAQTVRGSTAPSTPPKKPAVVKRSGQFNLKRGRR